MITANVSHPALKCICDYNSPKYNSLIAYKGPKQHREVHVQANFDIDPIYYAALENAIRYCDFKYKVDLYPTQLETYSDCNIKILIQFPTELIYKVFKLCCGECSYDILLNEYDHDDQVLDVKFTDCYVTYIKIYDEHNGVADIEVTFNSSWRIPHRTLNNEQNV